MGEVAPLSTCARIVDVAPLAITFDRERAHSRAPGRLLRAPEWAERRIAAGADPAIAAVVLLIAS